jgi:hypothetical protein
VVLLTSLHAWPGFGTGQIVPTAGVERRRGKARQNFFFFLPFLPVDLSPSVVARLALERRRPGGIDLLGDDPFQGVLAVERVDPLVALLARPRLLRAGAVVVDVDGFRFRLRVQLEFSVEAAAVENSRPSKCPGGA